MNLQKIRKMHKQVIHPEVIEFLIGNKKKVASLKRKKSDTVFVVLVL